MKILFSWTGVTSYMADCWRTLQAVPGIELRVIVETADSGKAFRAGETLKGLDYELVSKEKSADCPITTLASDFTPDILFVAGWRSLTTRRVLARYQNIPRIFCLDMPWRWSVRCFAARFALRGFVKQFDAVYVPGKSTAFYSRWLGFKKDRIYRKLYAIDQEKVGGGRLEGEGRTGFLFVGRLSPEKRVDLIEKAYARYRELGGTWPIDYYGQGGKFVQADGMPKVYSEHACLLLASSFDPWPLVMLESRVAGLEVIASDRCGNCDELGAHKVPYGNAGEMARKMVEVERGAKIAQREDLLEYDCRAWVPRTLEIAREVIAQSKREVNGMLVVDSLLRQHGLIKSDEFWVHGMWTLEKWAKCIGAKLRGKKLVRMTHGSLSPIYLERQGKWKKRLVKPIERFCFRLADRVVVTCAAEKEWCLQWGLKNEFEILDLKKFFDLGVDGSRSRRKDGSLHVLYLGRRHPLKGVEFLERAVDEIKGDATFLSRLELRIVSDHTGEELERDWEWCDVLCLPTLSENFGLVVAEALERGKRVITTDGAPAWAPEEKNDTSSLQLPTTTPDYNSRLIYLKGYRDGTDDERVRYLKRALEELNLGVGERCRCRVGLPLVTIGVKCLNLEKYVGAAVESAFAQTYRPLEIVISDDGSTDDTWRVVKDVVQAHEGEDIQVVLNRNLVNLGNCGNWEKICSLAKGDWIFKFDGDDISEPTRVERMMLSVREGDMSASSACTLISLDNRKVGIRAASVAGQAFGAVMAFHRATYDRFPRVKYPRVMDDVVWTNRARMLGTHCQVNEPLVRYRLGSGVVGSFANSRAGIRICNRTAIDESEQLRIDAAGNLEWTRVADEMRDGAVWMDKLLNGGTWREKIMAIRYCSKGKSIFGKTFLWLCLIPGPIGDGLIWGLSYIKRRMSMI